MAVTFKKRVIKIGVARAVTLPQSWVRYYGERADEITLMGGSILLIVPAGLESQGKALVNEMEEMPFLQQDLVAAPEPILTEGGIQA